jgi:hypothetical protein
MQIENVLKSIMFVAIFFLTAACNQIQETKTVQKSEETKISPSQVKIIEENGNYIFNVNGEPFVVKGVGLGNREFKLLKESGANSFRTWGTRDAAQILDSASKYNLKVALGLSMGQELHGFDYEDTAAVAKQLTEIKKEVKLYKDHPSLLCWVAGNELNLNTDGQPVNPKVYDALKVVVDYIHEVDPNHPVTTAFAGVDEKNIKIAFDRCPDLDFLSLQVYGGLDKLPEQVKNAGITKPYAVTEFGPHGHWEVEKTEWNREIEEPSAVKARGIVERMKIGLSDDICLGGFAFFWGQKQERTPTWYGMFLKSGEPNATVDELTKYWSGEYPENRAPKVEEMQMDSKNAIGNVYLEPGKEYSAKVFAFEPDGDTMRYEWTILEEVQERSEGGAYEKEPESLQLEIIENKNGEIKFISPSNSGEYRLFSYVYDGKNKVGTANVPFYVK